MCFICGEVRLSQHGIRALIRADRKIVKDDAVIVHIGYNNRTRCLTRGATRTVAAAGKNARRQQAKKADHRNCDWLCFSTNSHFVLSAKLKRTNAGECGTLSLRSAVGTGVHPSSVMRLALLGPVKRSGN